MGKQISERMKLLDVLLLIFFLVSITETVSAKPSSLLNSGLPEKNISPYQQGYLDGVQEGCNNVNDKESYSTLPLTLYERNERDVPLNQYSEGYQDGYPVGYNRYSPPS
jgi:hypothetical protein